MRIRSRSSSPARTPFRSDSGSRSGSPSRSDSGSRTRTRSGSLLAGVAAVLVSALALAGCSSDGGATGADGANADGANGNGNGSGGTSSSDGAFPVTVSSGAPGSATELTLEARPERIVSLSPTATENLFAVGAGDQVVAVDEYSYYPAEAPVEKGLSGYRPNVESVVAHDPDLVIVDKADPAFADGMAAVDVKVLELPAAATLSDAYAQIETLGAATGHVGDAAEVVANMTREIDEAIKSVPAEVRDAGLTYFHEVSSDYYSVTDATFLGAVYGEFGLKSIATGDSDYPQLAAEAIIDADPDFIFLADAASESITPEQVAARPGWDQITAVRDGRIEPLDEDLASRWGPRLPEFFRAIASVLSDADVPAASAR